MIRPGAYAGNDADTQRFGPILVVDAISNACSYYRLSWQIISHYSNPFRQCEHNRGVSEIRSGPCMEAS